MKLLHIADLHAGKTIGNITQVSRNEDLRYALEQVEKICKEERVSILLIAGDVFDKSNPGYESLELILDFLVRMNSLGLHTILISGNHDSYELLKSYKPLNKLANIHIFDRASLDMSKLIFEFENLKIACLPYPSERLLTNIGEDSNKEYAEKVRMFLKRLAEQVESSEYKILLSHIMVESAQVAGTEKQTSILDTYAIRADAIPDTFDYVALGHVHKWQRIEKADPKTYYAGSLYQIDFSEKGMDKYVNLVILENGDVNVKNIKLNLYRELKEFEIKDNESFHRFINYDINYIGSAYVKVIYYMDPTDINYNQKREKILKALGNKLVRLEVKIGTKKSVSVDATSFHENTDLVSMYIHYYKNNYGKSPTDEIVSILKSVIKEVEDETYKDRT